MNLKLCDFCGHHPLGANLFGQEGWQVKCACGSRGPRGETEEDARRRWNTRSIASAEATIREANGEASS